MYNSLGNYNFSNLIAMSSLLPNIASPATQMIFSGTDSPMNLANYSIFGSGLGFGYGSGYSAKSVIGTILGVGAIYAGGSLLFNRIEKYIGNKQAASAGTESKTARADNIRKEIAKQKEIVTTNSNIISEKTSELNSLNADLNVARATLERYGTSEEITNDRLAASNELNTLVETEKNAKTAWENAAEADKPRLQQEYEKAKKNREEKAAQLDELKSHEEEVKAAEKNIKRLESEIAAANSAINAANTKKENAENEINALQKELGNIEAELEAQEKKERAKAEQKEQKQAKKEAAKAAKYNDIEYADGTVASRAFGKKVDASSQNLGLPTNTKVDKYTFQRILNKYKLGTTAEKNIIRKWLNNNPDIENKDKYKVLIDKILKETN